MNDPKKPEGKLFKIWLNPLQLIDVDEPWATLSEKELKAKDLIKFLCTPGIESDEKGLIQRYREISQEKKRLFAAPAEERILEKLVWPLRHAKASYMVGNYLGTISLSGMVSEMVAMLLFEMSDLSLNNRSMNNKDEKALFGSPFEKLGQHRRVEVLHAFSIIDDDTKADFDLIRTTRRKYLHLWSQDHESIPKDACNSYNAAVSIVVKAIGQDIRDGMLMINPKLVKYLERSGVYKPEEDFTE